MSLYAVLDPRQEVLRFHTEYDHRVLGCRHRSFPPYHPRPSWKQGASKMAFRPHYDLVEDSRICLSESVLPC